MKKIFAFLPMFGLLGCASGANDISAAYVSPMFYKQMSCDELREEATAVSSRAAAAVGAQNKKAGQDTAAVVVGAVVFWPALFLMKGDGAQAAELSRLKGEMDAIERVSRQRGCNIRFAEV